jgi:hypothetical protein
MTQSQVSFFSSFLSSLVILLNLHLSSWLCLLVQFRHACHWYEYDQPRLLTTWLYQVVLGTWLPVPGTLELTFNFTVHDFASVRLFLLHQNNLAVCNDFLEFGIFHSCSFLYCGVNEMIDLSIKFLPPFISAISKQWVKKTDSRRPSELLYQLWN